MDTTVFDVVHMFSERGISAVPIIDENGVVVNLYETVDVIVSILLDGAPPCIDLIACTDTGPSRGIPSSRLDNCRGSEPTLARFPWCSNMYRVGFNRHASSTHQKAACSSPGRR